MCAGAKGRANQTWVSAKLARICKDFQDFKIVHCDVRMGGRLCKLAGRIERKLFSQKSMTTMSSGEGQVASGSAISNLISK